MFRIQLARNTRVPAGPRRLRNSLAAGSVCSRSGGCGRDLTTSVRSKRFAGDSGVSLQPKRSGGKAGVRTREKRGPRFSIGLEPSLVAPQYFNAPPQVLAGHARRHLPSGLSRVRAVAPVLIENATPPNDSFACSGTLCAARRDELMKVQDVRERRPGPRWRRPGSPPAWAHGRPGTRDRASGLAPTETATALPTPAARRGG